MLKMMLQQSSEGVRSAVENKIREKDLVAKVEQSRNMAIECPDRLILAFTVKKQPERRVKYDYLLKLISSLLCGHAA